MSIAFLLASFVLHGAMLAAGTPREQEASAALSVTLPVELSFGLADADEEVEVPPVRSPDGDGPSVRKTGVETPTPSIERESVAPPKKESAFNDTDTASVPSPVDDAERVLIAESAVEAEVDPKGSEDATSSAAEAGATSGWAGGFFAIRLHLGALRASPHAAEVERLLRELPHLQAVFAGTGVDLLRDLDRLFLAVSSADVEASIVVATHAGDAELPTWALLNRAAGRERMPSYAETRGVRLAEWPDARDQARQIVVLETGTFAIARAEDWARLPVLARHAEAETRVPDERLVFYAPLLVLTGPGVEAEVEIENVSKFVSEDHDDLPRRVVARLIRFDGLPRIVLEVEFESEDEARLASVSNSTTRHRFVRSLVNALGLRDQPAAVSLSRDGRSVRFEVEISEDVLETVLSFVRAATWIKSPEDADRRGE